MVPKSENYQELNESSGAARDRKLRKRKEPRRRDYAVRKNKELVIERSKKVEIEKAKEKIIKHLSGFPDLESGEGKKQAERYLVWVVGSLSENFPDLSEGDIEYKTATASVKAGGQKRQKTRSSVRVTHSPTLISVRNEEERGLEENKRAARENLFDRLDEHLSLWQTISRLSPKMYSISDIERQGVDLLKELEGK